MEPTSKKDLAVAFLEELANMSPTRLRDVISNIVGEELAGVMFNYANQVMKANPNKMIENASSMLILGYLIHAHEKGLIPPETPPV